jgi:hypothetical protein
LSKQHLSPKLGLYTNHKWVELQGWDQAYLVSGGFHCQKLAAKPDAKEIKSWRANEEAAD